MKKIFTLIVGISIAGIIQAQLVTGISITAPFAGNMAGELGQVEDMKFFPTITPTNAADKTVTWSIESGADVAELVDASNGIVKALKGGTFTIKVTANDGSGIFKEATYIIADEVPIRSKGLFLNFNEGSPKNLYLPEKYNEYYKKTDSTRVTLTPVPDVTPDTLVWNPVYRIDMTSASMILNVDKAGPLGADGKPIFLYRREPGYRFSAMRISLCPAFNTLVEMPEIKKINIKMKSSSDLQLNMGWCSYNFRGNTGNSVTRSIAQDTATYRTYTFDFTNLSGSPATGNVVDSNNISHLFLNFNPPVGAYNPEWWKASDCKAKLEIQYISFGAMASVIPVEKITITGPGFVELNRTGKYDFEISPSNATNQEYVLWSTNDPSIATIDGNGNLSPKKEGKVNIIATSADIEAGIPVVTKAEYEVTIGPPNALTSVSTDFFVNNPVSDRLTIGGVSDLSYVDIISLTGKVIKSVQNTSANHLYIDMSNVPVGIYIVKCYAVNGEVITKKIVKQ